MNETQPSRSQQQVVQPNGPYWLVCHPTETTTATQLRLGKYEVLGLYWHLESGFKRTAGRTIHTNESDAQKAMLHSEITKRLKELKLLKAELVRLNGDYPTGKG